MCFAPCVLYVCQFHYFTTIAVLTFGFYHVMDIPLISTNTCYRCSFYPSVTLAIGIRKNHFSRNYQPEVGKYLLLIHRPSATLCAITPQYCYSRKFLLYFFIPFCCCIFRFFGLFSNTWIAKHSHFCISSDHYIVLLFPNSLVCFTAYLLNP